MYIVLKSFAGKEYSGTKGKPIEIKDKDFAKSLIKAGFIAEYSKQDKKNADKDKEIVELKSTISKLTDENTKLEEEKASLEEKMCDPSIATDVGKLQELSKKIEETDNRLSEAYEEWERLAE